MFQVDLSARPSLVYSNNYIKAAQTGGVFSVLHLLSQTIIHTTNFLAGDTRREIDITSDYIEVVHAPSLNALSMIMYNFKVKEVIFRYHFLLADSQDFLAGYQNAINKDDCLKTYAN